MTDSSSINMIDSFAIKSLKSFLDSETVSFHNQASFEFRYPVLFKSNSFLIDQLDYPQLDTNVGYIWVDGIQIPIHSTPKFGNDLSFVMYARNEFLKTNEDYAKIYEAIVSDNHNIFYNIDNKNEVPKAYIIPLPSKQYNTEINDLNVLTLHNALIKSISLQGGFSANSIAISKFSVSMTYAYFTIENKMV